MMLFQPILCLNNPLSGLYFLKKHKTNETPDRIRRGEKRTLLKQKTMMGVITEQWI